MTVPIVFVAAGLVLTHGPLAVLGVRPDPEAITGPMGMLKLFMCSPARDS